MQAAKRGCVNTRTLILHAKLAQSFSRRASSTNALVNQNSLRASHSLYSTSCTRGSTTMGLPVGSSADR
jgi:hypothetical protein